MGYVLALTQFIMTWVLSWLYLRRSDRVFDPLARRAAEAAKRSGVPSDAAARPGPPAPGSSAGPEVTPR